MRGFRLLLLFLTLALFFVARQLPDGKLKVVFCDVGQGDAAIVIKGSFQALIDTGPRGGNVVECLGAHLPFWDHEIETLINSHPEVDHLGGLSSVVGHYKVGTLIVDGKMPGEELAKTIKDMIKAGTKVVTAAAGDRLRYGDLYFDILWPEKKYEDLADWLGNSEAAILGKEAGLNRYSLVTLLRQGDTSILFTGDISEEEERQLVGSRKLSVVNLLKIAHHGSKYSSSEDFLEVVRPKITVFSVGKNSYGHPTAEAMERVKAVGSQIWRTDKQGELVMNF